MSATDANTHDQPVSERLSPTVRGLVRAMYRNAAQPEWTIERHRMGFEEATTPRPLAPGVEIERISTPGGAAEWVRPPGSDDRQTVLYLHGGGFIMGSINTTRAMATHLALATGRPLVILEYSLAPEVRFPTQPREACDTYAWLCDQVGAAQLVVMGDSAGGALAMSAILEARRRGLPMPAAAVLLSPLLDLRMQDPGLDHAAEHDPQLPRWLLSMMCSSYLGPDHDAENPLASPVLADLRDFPPILVHAAELEGLRGDSELLSVRARECGVRCDLEIWPGMIHVWHAFAPRLPEAAAAFEQIAGWLDMTVGIQ